MAYRPLTTARALTSIRDSTRIAERCCYLDRYHQRLAILDAAPLFTTLSAPCSENAQTNLLVAKEANRNYRNYRKRQYFYTPKVQDMASVEKRVNNLAIRVKVRIESCFASSSSKEYDVWCTAWIIFRKLNSEREEPESVRR